VKGPVAVFLLLAVSAPSWAAEGPGGPARPSAEAAPQGGAREGVFGSAGLRGKETGGLTVLAFPGGSGADPSSPPVASTLTGDDGSYRLALPPGTYSLVARTGRAGERPRPGELFCYFSGSPVTVRKDEWVPVGFNLVLVPAEERSRGDRSALEGVVAFQGRPLEKLYLTLYRDQAGSFRGPGIATYPVGAGGRFKVGVPPGSYYLVARKRSKGGMVGPVETGDLFSYYPGNPVTVGEREVVRVALEAVERLSQLEGQGERRAPRVTGRLVDGTGGAVAGVRVFAYPAPAPTSGGTPVGGDREGKGRPLAFSDPSDPEGRFTLELPADGLYLLVARPRLGRRPASGEWRGEYRGGEPLRVEGGSSPPITFTVGREP